MDTKPLEHEALHEIQSKMARFGYKYANINFDENGGDFYIIGEIDNNRCVYLRGQSKGRSINNNSSNVVIPKDYVQDGFLVFVYVKPEDPDDVATFLYTTEDIKTYGERTIIHTLCICPKTLSTTVKTIVFCLKKQGLK